MSASEDIEKAIIKHLRKHPTTRYSRSALMSETGIFNSYGMSMVLRSLYSQKKISKIAAINHDGEYVETYGVSTYSRAQKTVF